VTENKSTGMKSENIELTQKGVEFCTPKQLINGDDRTLSGKMKERSSE
jgi:hypothetical protein